MICCWPCDPANHTPTHAFVPERRTPLLDEGQEQRRAVLRELYPDEDLTAVAALADLREALAQAGLTALYGAALVRRGQALHVHGVGPRCHLAYRAHRPHVSSSAPRPQAMLESRPVRLAARRLLREAREREGVFVRPEGESWKRAGVAWRAARLLLDSGRAVVYGTKSGWFTGAWHFREVIVGTPEMDAHFAQRYPGCRIERSSRPRAVAKEKA